MTKNIGKKFMSVALSAALAFSIIPSMGTSLVVQAAEEKTVDCFGVKSIKDPEPGAADKEWTGSYVWYGAYDGTPVRYRVLDAYDTGKLFLDCDSVLFEAAFDNDGIPNEGASSACEWLYSDIRASLNGEGFLNKANGFSDLEKNAIVPTTTTSHQITKGAPGNVYCPNTAALDNDYIFLLDFEDTLNPNYGYCEDCGYDTTNQQLKNHHSVDCKKKIMYYENGVSYISTWFLRTMDVPDKKVAIINIVKGIDSWEDASQWGYFYIRRADVAAGISPAFNVDKDKILFSSVIPGTENGEYADYKLTLKDPNLTIGECTKATRTGRKVTIPYSIGGSSKKKATQVSVLIVDGEEYGKINGEQKNPNLRYYGKLNVDGDFATSGQGTFNLPSEFDPDKWGKDYWVYIVADTVNGEHETDYASEPSIVYSPTVAATSEYTVTVNNDGNGTATASVQKAVPGTTVTLTATPNSGYKFKEWKVVSGGVTIDNNTFTIDESNVEIMAVFEEIPGAFCTVSFDSNGGTGSMYKIVVEKNTAFTLPACSFTAPEGKEFDKWDKGAAGSEIKVPGDTIIKAIWKDKAVTTTPEPTSTPEPTPTSEPTPTPDITRDANDISPSNPVKVDEIEKTILSIKDEKDTAGSTFTLLKAKGTPKSKKSIKLSWSKVPGAEEYIIYGNKCGKKNKYQKIATVKGTSYTAKKLKKGTYYKYTIVAVKGDEAIATSKAIHVVTDGGKKGNNTKVKLSKTKLSLAAGKSKKIKATLKYNKKVASHRKVAWESDNVSIATVKNGKITAVGKGTCYVYAYAQNGVSAKIKITVK